MKRESISDKFTDRVYNALALVFFIAPIAAGKINPNYTAFLMPIDYFVYHRRQGVAALRSL